MLSKSKGQVLRVAAVLHVLFHMDSPTTIAAYALRCMVYLSLNSPECYIMHNLYTNSTLCVIQHVYFRHTSLKKVLFLKMKEN